MTIISMKQQLAGIELIRLVKELKEILIGGKINQVYIDREKKEMLFEFYVSNKGRQLLRIIFPSFMYISSVKPENPAVPDGYCLYLRKYLKNARVKDIVQIGAERIVCISVEARDITQKEFVPVNYKLYVELFSKGNFILTTEEDIILSPFDIQQWAGRTIKAKEKYIYPQQEYNVFKMGEKDFEKALSQSTKESIVTTVAINLGLGGIYAEEICVRAGIPKDAKPMLNPKKVYEAFQELIHDVENNPAIIVMKDNVQDDVFPCSLKAYTETVSYASFVEALDKYFTPFVMKKDHVQQVSKKEKAEQKIKTMIASQEKQIILCEEKYHTDQKIAETIYQNYIVLEPICRELKHARKSSEEIKKIIKKYPHIKRVNEKNQEVLVEI